MDGYAVTRSASSTDWGAVCYELLGAIPDNINGGRIEMGWLRDTFPEPDNDSTELGRIRYARAYILEMIRRYLMPDLSRNLVHLRWLLKLVDFRAAGELSWGSAVLATLYKEMCRATRPNQPKIGGCLSLLQSWARFRFPFLRPRVDHPYTFPFRKRAVIPNEFLQNPNAWHVKVALVNYATVEMHQSDRVLRQFGFRQPIFVAPEVFDNEHKVNLR
ncbi:hypothetical protein CXB51_016878 [Gossypium anomalum]|uniref:Aminotransferase-like plant mobile domain-containing protein n=1 Tax=Gossypium anomalum TaxID=47600 RepID=A0A8J5Z0K8_9ROSI|nr:hypothetical protein CXB51_016878 [Gossypium anomalum]